MLNAAVRENHCSGKEKWFRCADLSSIVEELMAERAVLVSDETIQLWRNKFGQTCANNRAAEAHPNRRHVQPRQGLSFASTAHFLTRGAVDQRETH